MAQAMCPKHFDAPVRGTCHRCGAFGCSDCLTLTAASEWTCQACRARVAGDLPSLTGRAQLARLSLLANGGLGLLVDVLSAINGENEEGVLVILAGLAALGFFVLFVVTIVLFCRWFHLAVRHAEARSILTGSTPAAAVGSWFIPFVNLSRPFQVTRTMLDGAGRDSASLVGPWQATWIIGNITTNIGFRMGNSTVALIASVVMLGSAILAVRVVDAVTAAFSEQSESRIIEG